MNYKKGQLTIFVILAIVIVAFGIGFFIFNDLRVREMVPSDFRPLQESFLDCIRSHASTGISILQSRGGYIDSPEFVPGSRYMPFSSELDFFGVDIPYWHYISGNNRNVEQIPTIEDMEKRLKDFLEMRIPSCSFEEYRASGISFNLGPPEVLVDIKENSISLDVKSDFFIFNEKESVLIRDHSVEINSRFGSLYEKAKEVYEIQEKTFFLENYSLDVLWNYFPVNGMEITCSPLTWNLYDLHSEFLYALESNIYAIRNKGEENDYFALNLPVDADLRFIFFRDWPNTLEVDPADGPILIAKPVGTQAGLGVLGFCYVPYHFVYDLRFPVLVQVSEGEETFQFPLVVLIEGNLPRQARVGDNFAYNIPNLCDYENNTLTRINLYNSDLEEVDGRVSFECFSSICDLGLTEKGFVEGNLPQCVNGRIIIEAEGYRKKSIDYTSVYEGELNIILDREYEREVNLFADGFYYSGNAIISFISKEDSTTLIYPSQKKVKLGEGSYDIQVQLFDDASLNLPSSVREECYNVPSPGIGGILGFTKRECQEVEVPEQIISKVLIGGGKGNYFFLEMGLSQSNSINLNVGKLGIPESLEDLQNNYILFETSNVEVELK